MFSVKPERRFSVILQQMSIRFVGMAICTAQPLYKIYCFTSPCNLNGFHRLQKNLYAWRF